MAILVLMSPGVPVNNYSHVIDLDNATQSVGQKYFKQPTTLKKGITLGLKHLLQARKVILIANGIKKAEVIRKALEEEINTDITSKHNKNSSARHGND